MGKQNAGEFFESYLDKIKVNRVTSFSDIKGSRLIVLANKSSFNFPYMNILNILKIETSENMLPFMEQKIVYNQRAKITLDALSQKVSLIDLWTGEDSFKVSYDCYKSYEALDYFIGDEIYCIDSKNFSQNFLKLFETLNEGFHKEIRLTGVRGRINKRCLNKRDIDTSLFI